MAGGGEAALDRVHTAFRRRHFRRQWTARTDDAIYVYGDRNQYQKLATLLTQVFVTTRLIKRPGVGGTLMVMPLVTVVVD